MKGYGEREYMKKLILLLMMICMLGITACGKNSMTESKNTKLSKEAVDINIVRENAQSDYENAKTKYTNLKFKDIIPYCTPLNKVYDIEDYQLDNYKGITDEKEMYEEQMKLINHYIGTDLDDKYFCCGYYDLDTNEYDSFTEFKHDLIDNGKKMDATWLGYIDNTYNGYDKQEIRSAEIQRTLVNVFFDNGEAYELIPEEIREADDTLGGIADMCELARTYYVYEEGERLDDIYRLKDGDLSVRDAIEFVNDYLNNDLMVEGNENVKLQVSKVYVYKLNDECYCYRFVITRNIYGMLMRATGIGCDGNNLRIEVDISGAYMVRTDKLDSYAGRTSRLNCKILNETDKVISLDTALRHISESIGDNSKYIVTSAEMAYMNVHVEDLTENGGTMTPSWLIKCINEIDNSYTDFYVNLRTGDVNVYQYYDID